ncbi:peptide chain release factor N(5)-glutamine methyltransferase [Cumulibacter manganitolerans]|uniref:peptide chain release factor N(5)-glutamine methyltransferase n=1 Tax=Cumulibacter manganitolerans TaxID=1884992 RepID=UPI00188616AB|nr:peptide chain release factor N(5)-glutamine methyltransferase [Cumulibacter manganitolerans]
MIGPGPVSAARRAATAELAAAGVGSPAFDAAELLADVLGVSRGLLPTADDLNDRQAAAYAALVARRARREPLQHILGSAGFYGLDVAVGPGVFIPRPETELLVAQALEGIAQVAAPVVVDLCAGSGAIAIALAVRRPTASVTAVEASAEAVGWLRRNVQALAPTVRIVHGDVLDGSLPVLPVDDERARPPRERPADLVTCNPPYVPLSSSVDHETEAHDPRVAVFAGADGLDLIRPLVGRVAELLRPGGIVLMEHDESHQDAVVALYEQSGQYAAVTALADLAGRPRFVRAVRR